MVKDMTPERILATIGVYEYLLKKADVPKTQAPPGTYFGKLSEKDQLAHAHFLCDLVKEVVNDPELWGKTNRLFAALQMCLSNAGWYTLEELKDHNRPN